MSHFDDGLVSVPTDSRYIGFVLDPFCFRTIVEICFGRSWDSTAWDDRIDTKDELEAADFDD